MLLSPLFASAAMPFSLAPLYCCCHCFRFDAFTLMLFDIRCRCSLMPP
jgi:hypothetical protein